MIDFGDTLKLLDEEPVQEQKVRYKGDSHIYQEAKKAKADVDDEEPDTSEKYDDKYDLDNDQGATIEPADVDVDDDFDYGTSDENDEDSDDKDDKKDKKSKKKKKSSKKKDTKDTKDDDTDKDNTSDDNDEEIDVEEEGFGAGMKEVGRQFVKDIKGTVGDYVDYGKGILSDIKDDVTDITDAGSVKKGLKEVAFTPYKALKQYSDRVDDFEINARKRQKEGRNAIYDAFHDDPAERAAKKVKRAVGHGIEKVGEKISESYHYQEAASLIKKHAKQDIDEAMESRVGENNYYTSITNSSKDLEHLYKTLLKRASRETILEEMNNIFNELKERRNSYFSGKSEDAHDPKRSYQGLKRIIDQDIENIENNIKILSDPKQTKPNKSLMKKTIKMINNLQQDMITECERSQPAVIRHARDIAKKLWLFEYDTEETDGDITMESGEDAMFAKVGEMLVHYRKQKELQDLAEKNGVEINGMRLTDDAIMNIVTSCIALMMAKEEGDPRYRQLVDQGMKKRSLKVDIINSYKSRANDLINRYDHGPIVGAEPYRRDIEVISDEDAIEEEFYVDENGEMQSTYYQEADKDDSDSNLDEDDDAIDDEKDTDSESKDEDNSKDDDEEKDKDNKEESDDEDDEPEETDDDSDDKDDEEDDEEEDELEEEFYIDPVTGEMKSSWYAEMDESYDGAGGVSNSKRKEFDEEKIEWEVKPGKEVEDIEFGATRNKTQKKLEKDFGAPKKSDMESDDYGKFVVYYESDKVARVTIVKDIEVELDRSIVFPGKIDNLRKKALDLKPGGDGKLISRVMSIEVQLNSDDTINHITFARRQYYSDKAFQKFDKAKWHIDQGMGEKEVVKRFKEVYKFLDKHSLLTAAGKEEMKYIGPDTVLTTNEVTERGAQFLRSYYDKCSQYDYHTIRDQLEQCWKQFTSQSYSKGD